jgi:hypothetical protein
MRNALREDTRAIPQTEPNRLIRHVVDIDPVADSRYDAFVHAHPDALIYHHPAWLEVLAKENGQRPVCLASEDTTGQLNGILALFQTRGLPLVGGQLTGRRLSSLPRTPVAGPLTSDRFAAAALIRAAANRVEDNPVVPLQIKTASNDFDDLVDGVVGNRWRPCYMLELPARTEDLRFGSSRHHARIRSTVNKAERLNIRIREADSECDLRAWYDIYLETMRWHVIPPRSYRFFKSAWDILRPHGFLRLLVAEMWESARPCLLAGSIFLTFGHTFVYAYNGCRRAAFSLQPNDVIQWRAIHDACNEGFSFYDLGEAPETHTGLSFFKSKWGAQEKWLYRYYYPAPHRFQNSTLQNGMYPALRMFWRKLPLKATMLFGDCLYRYL